MTGRWVLCALQVSHSAQQHEEITLALLYSILTDPNSASKVSHNLLLVKRLGQQFLFKECTTLSSSYYKAKFLKVNCILFGLLFCYVPPLVVFLNIAHTYCHIPFNLPFKTPTLSSSPEWYSLSPVLPHTATDNQRQHGSGGQHVGENYHGEDDQTPGYHPTAGVVLYV